MTLSPQQKQAIVDRHNEIRGQVYPSATNMQKLNMAWSTASDPMEAIKEWQKEIDNFKYGTNSGKVFGRYSQLIWDETGRVGCGMADCSQFLANYPTFFICNYAVGGNTNWAGRGWIPYTQGDSCGACPGKCDSTGKLCDCGGLVCNGGTVDVSTCSCK
ncbi:hypothetical protein BaRGS_00009580 [Batillaria attramentaria]|uniref:SCP domain-containing protein n=1 Tax=Batillaria attramentaria TaxID=370345 RepID=A0ABD0LIP6_9CAEN